MTPRIVDHYELHEELGHGGMATVYRATDTRLQREVALKLLHEHIAARPENRSRFIREARAAARLRHPNILQIYNFSHPDDLNGYMATELINGPTLRAMDIHDLYIYPELAACLMWIITGALEEAHKAGIIHRDIKPENIMIDAHGAPRLMDFGLARVRDGERMTATGTLMGSPAHMAPEIVEGKDYDKRVDIFALGTVLYYLCTGTLPFDANNPATLLQKILGGQYVPAQERNERIVAPLNDIIDRMLARNPADRYASAQAVQEDLSAYLHALDQDAPDQVFRHWWNERDAFIKTWKPKLIARITTLAETAVEAGKSHIPEALDWANRLLILDPGSEAGNNLLLRISTQSAHAALRRRILMIVLAMIATAVPLLTLRFCIMPPDPPSITHDGLVTTTYLNQLRGAQELHAEHVAQNAATYVHGQALDVAGNPTLHTIILAAEKFGEARDRASEEAQKRAAALRREASHQALRNQRDATSNKPNNRAETPQDEHPTRHGPNLLISVLPPKAELYLDGEKVCENTPRCELELPQGQYRISGRHPDTGMESHKNVQIRGGVTRVFIRVPWKPATLLVESNRPGVVMFNNQRVGRTNESIQVQIEGLHSSIKGRMRVIPDGDFGTPVERDVELSSGETRRDRVQF